MAYIGTKPTIGNFQICDAISVVNGQAAYTMQVGGVNVSPQSSNHMIVSLNGTIQKPGGANPSFTVSGSTITFASNLATGDVIDFIQILGDVLDLGVPSDATVTTAKLANSAVDLTSKVTGALPVANGGTNLTSNFKNGITVADTWRVNTGFTLNISPTDLTTNWERADTYSPGYIGTGMSESSGIFTFPQTGIYHIFNQVSFHQSGSDTHDWVYMRCYATTDNSNYNAASIGLGHIQDSADEISVCSSFIFDVTDTTTHKVKFQVSKQSGSDSVNVGASSSENRTYATFIRLGDT